MKTAVVEQWCFVTDVQVSVFQRFVPWGKVHCTETFNKPYADYAYIIGMCAPRQFAFQTGNLRLHAVLCPGNDSGFIEIAISAIVQVLQHITQQWDVDLHVCFSVCSYLRTSSP